MRDDLWTLPILAGACLLIAGILIGHVATDRVQGALVDAYTDGRVAESYADRLAVCEERAALLDSLQVEGDYAEVDR